MTKEFFDEHVRPDWAEDEPDTSSVKSEDAPKRLPSKTMLWQWSDLGGNLPTHMAKRIYEEGFYYSLNGSRLVNPYKGTLVGKKVTDADNPFYVVCFNPGKGFKHPAYLTTTCPEEYVAIMQAFDREFIPAESLTATKHYQEWSRRNRQWRKNNN
jgi:hypothetical protein